MDVKSLLLLVLALAIFSSVQSLNITNSTSNLPASIATFTSTASSNYIFRSSGRSVTARQPSPFYIGEVPGGTFKLGWTDSSGTAHVSTFNIFDAYQSDISLGTGNIRGLYVHPNGTFAALIQRPVNDTVGEMFIRRYGSTGTMLWSTQLETSGATDFSLGDSKLILGEDNLYWAYYKVHGTNDSRGICDRTWALGHEGDTTMKINPGTGAATAHQCWGCSHSMAGLLTHNNETGKTMRVCVTDCYPGSPSVSNPIGGIYVDHNKLAIKSNVYANCGGQYGAELGGLMAIGNSSALVYNAPSRSYSPKQAWVTGTKYDVSFATITRSGSSYSKTNMRTLATGGNYVVSAAALKSNDSILVGYVHDNGTHREHYYQLFDYQGRPTCLPEKIDAPFAERTGFFTMSNGDVIWPFPSVSGSKYYDYNTVTSSIKIYRMRAAEKGTPIPVTPDSGAAATTSIGLMLLLITLLAHLLF